MLTIIGLALIGAMPIGTALWLRHKFGISTKAEDNRLVTLGYVEFHAVTILNKTKIPYKLVFKESLNERKTEIVCAHSEASKAMLPRLGELAQDTDIHIRFIQPWLEYVIDTPRLMELTKDRFKVAMVDYQKLN
jgi:hypothetical protein